MDKHVKMFFKYASSLEFEDYIEARVKNISYIFNHFDKHTHTQTHMHISAYTYICVYTNTLTNSVTCMEY